MYKIGTAGLGRSDLLTQNLCTWCTFGLESFSPRWLYIYPHLLQVFTSAFPLSKMFFSWPCSSPEISLHTHS